MTFAAGFTRKPVNPLAFMETMLVDSNHAIGGGASVSDVIEVATSLGGEIPDTTNLSTPSGIARVVTGHLVSAFIFTTAGNVELRFDEACFNPVAWRRSETWLVLPSEVFERVFRINGEFARFTIVNNNVGAVNVDFCVRATNQ